MTATEHESADVTRSRVIAAAPPDWLREATMMGSVVCALFVVVPLLMAAFVALSQLQPADPGKPADAEVIAAHGGGRHTVRYLDERGVPRQTEVTSRVDLPLGARTVVRYQPGNGEQTYASEGGDSVPTYLFLVGVSAASALYILHLWREVRRREEHYARLRRGGTSIQPEALRSAQVPWGKFTRWTLVATWVDHNGRRHETLSGPYNESPGPVDTAGVRVLVDTHDPTRSVLAPETLPPLHGFPRRKRGARDDQP